MIGCPSGTWLSPNGNSKSGGMGDNMFLLPGEKVAEGRMRGGIIALSNAPVVRHSLTYEVPPETRFDN